jgi:tetratricopeptide (TPR) repeat protein
VHNVNGVNVFFQIYFAILIVSHVLHFVYSTATKFLVKKEYRAAIEEYVSALFLVPVDPNLSPDLHLGRAHALNGSRPHESARNDALLAIKLNPTPAAYSTMATLFYMKEYAASVDAFDKCIQLQPPGELPSFRRALPEKLVQEMEKVSVCAL